MRDDMRAVCVWRQCVVGSVVCVCVIGWVVWAWVWVGVGVGGWVGRGWVGGVAVGECNTVCGRVGCHRGGG